MNGSMGGVNGIADSSRQAARQAGRQSVRQAASSITTFPSYAPPSPALPLFIPTTLINFSGCTFEICQKDAIGNAIKFEIPPQPAAAAVGPVTQIGNNCVYMSVYILYIAVYIVGQINQIMESALLMHFWRVLRDAALNLSYEEERTRSHKKYIPCDIHT